MSVCVYSVSVLPCVDSGLATGCSPVQGVLPTVHRIKKLKKKSGQGPKGCRTIEKKISGTHQNHIIHVTKFQEFF
jgi:hypothetical protein